MCPKLPKQNAFIKWVLALFLIIPCGLQDLSQMAQVSFLLINWLKKSKIKEVKTDDMHAKLTH